VKLVKTLELLGLTTDINLISKFNPAHPAACDPAYLVFSQ
jgi:hypothetical protein